MMVRQSGQLSMVVMDMSELIPRVYLKTQKRPKKC